MSDAQDMTTLEQINTFLSPQVKSLYTVLTEDQEDPHQVVSWTDECICSERFIFDDIRIRSIKFNIILNKASDDFLFWKKALEEMRPLFRAAHSVILNYTSHQLLKDKTLTWLTEPLVLKACIESVQSDAGDESSSTSSIESALLLIPVLERSLGNLIYSSDSGAQVPSLLKDLLVRSNLLDIIHSDVLIFLLRLILGTPKSLNLRNVLWHGFAIPGLEIPLSVVSTLILIILSIDVKLTLVEGQSRLRRRPDHSLNSAEKMLDSLKVCSDLVLVDQLREKLLRFHDALGRNKYVIMNRVLQLYDEANYKVSLYLLLPEWESLMRRIFAMHNDCPDKVTTAEVDSYYVTFDEIVAPNLNFGSCFGQNRFPGALGVNHLEFLFDLLLLEHGPRLRDKISHGEVVEGNFRQCVELIMCSFSDALPHLLPNYDRFASAPNFLDNYVSLYHPVALLREDLKSCFEVLQTKCQNGNHLWPTPEEIPYQLPHCDYLHHLLSFHLFDTMEIKCKLSEVCSALNASGGLLGYDSGDVYKTIVTFLETEPVYEHSNRTLFRHKREYELWSLWRRLLIKVTVTCEEIEQNLEQKHKYLRSEIFRSRQKKTYTRMLETIPFIHLAFLLIFIIIAYDLTKFYEGVLENIPCQSFAKMLKIRKKMLKVCENLANYVSRRKNRWEESLKMVEFFAVDIFPNEFV